MVQPVSREKGKARVNHLRCNPASLLKDGKVAVGQAAQENPNSRRSSIAKLLGLGRASNRRKTEARVPNPMQLGRQDMIKAALGSGAPWKWQVLGPRSSKSVLMPTVEAARARGRHRAAADRDQAEHLAAVEEH